MFQGAANPFRLKAFTCNQHKRLELIDVSVGWYSHNFLDVICCDVLVYCNVYCDIL